VKRYRKPAHNCEKCHNRRVLDSREMPDGSGVWLLCRPCQRIYCDYDRPRIDKWAIVAEHFPHRPTKEVAYMCDCSAGTVQRMAQLLGVRKTAQARANSFHAGRERYLPK
jgi:hypothetical protein